jgi:hypothetical protein
MPVQTRDINHHGLYIAVRIEFNRLIRVMDYEKLFV